jgi:hypothetical protein
MYKALKDAQSDIHATLLKLVDDISGVSESRVQPQVQAQQPQQVQAQLQQPQPELQNLQNTLGFLHQKQNAQFELLVGEIRGLKETMENMMKFMMARDAINTATTIPVLQPTSKESDMKEVFIDSDANDIEVNEELNTGFIEETESENEAEVEQEAEAEQEPETEEAEAEVEQEAEVEAEAEQEVQAEQEVEEAEADANAEEAEAEEVDANAEEAEAEPEQEAEPEEEAGIEVEEWTYKGRQFFKDSDNTVYANNAGEIGDPIGQYDPVKNIVKKLAQ